MLLSMQVKFIFPRSGKQNTELTPEGKHIWKQRIHDSLSTEFSNNYKVYLNTCPKSLISFTSSQIWVTDTAQTIHLALEYERHLCVFATSTVLQILVFQEIYAPIPT